jgi:hypothetical protein
MRHLGFPQKTYTKKRTTKYRRRLYGVHDIPDEIWRHIPSSKHYMVSNLGRVKSCVGKYDLLLREGTHPSGYKHVSISISNENGVRRICRKVHQLVLEAFVGNRPFGHECGHLNGNPGDNRLSNLRWITKTENQHHRFIHGISSCGESCKSSKLSARDVFLIRRIRDISGITYNTLASIFDTSQENIYRIVNNKSWKFMSNEDARLSCRVRL